MITLIHNDAQYFVGSLVAEAKTYRVYFCKDNNERQYLLQVSTASEHNGSLHRAAFILDELKSYSDLIESEHAEAGQKNLLCFDLLFPELIDSFVCDEQGKRRINILALKGIEDINSIVPLSNLLIKDKLRLSLKTSAWIMGRLLKLMSFTHKLGISIRQLGGNNVLIEPEHHRMVVFDWTMAFYHQGEVPKDVCTKDISDAAKTVFGAIGGNILTGKYPYDYEDDKFCKYVEFIWNLTSPQMVDGKKTKKSSSSYEDDAEEAHRQFYELVDVLFGRGYIPSEFLTL